MKKSFLYTMPIKSFTLKLVFIVCFLCISQILLSQVSGGNPPYPKAGSPDKKPGTNTGISTADTQYLGNIKADGGVTNIKFEGSGTIPPGYRLVPDTGGSNYPSSDNSFNGDNSERLNKFRPLGLSFIFFLFSIYLFYVATKLYHEYFDKKKLEEIINWVFGIGSAVIIFVWTFLVFKTKGIDVSFLDTEIINYPNQFVMGFLLASILLQSVGIFRFAIVAFIPTIDEDSKKLRDVRFSFVGMAFYIVNAIASILTLYGFIK